MDKQTFYTELTARLDALGVAQEYIARHMKQFDSYFEGKSEEEIRHEIERLGDLDRVAARIKRMTDKLIEQEAEDAAAREADTEISEIEPTEPMGDAAEESEEASAEPAGDESTESADHETESVGETETSVDEDENKDDSSEADAYLDDDVITFTPLSRSQVFTEADAEETVLPDDPKEELSLIQSYEGRRRGSTSISDPGRIVKTTLDEETVRRNTRKFWILFLLTLPITLAVIAATAAVFASIFFVIAVLIIALVAVLVAITATGTMVSVFGLIFGVAQMLSNLPIGLYECGLSIIFGASAMFAGIIVYNIAVRLLPFTARWLLVLFKFIFRKYKELFVYLKKECIGL